VDKSDRIHALELEIQGIDVELKEARLLHRSLTVKIESLEADRVNLTYEINRIRYEQQRLL
jgi:hypothetical protein